MMKRKSRILPLFAASLFLLLTPQIASAQNDSSRWLRGWNITTTSCYGRILKHTTKFQPEIQDPSKAFELTIARQLHGRQMWECVHHYPVLGISMAYNDLGNDEVLGKAISFLPHIEIPIIGGNKFSATFRVGSGLAYLTKPYDVVENPTNNVIASHFNDITQFVVTGNWKPSDKVTFSLGTSFTHYSTGAVRLPNLGINIPAWRIGIRYQPKPFFEK